MTDVEIPPDAKVDRSPDARKVAAEIERRVNAEIMRPKPPVREEDRIRLGPDVSAQIIADAGEHPPGSFERLRGVWKAAIENRAWYHRLKGKTEEEARRLAEDETRADFNRTEDYTRR